MKKLLRFTLTVLLSVVCGTMWAQEATGSGTLADPWNAVAANNFAATLAAGEETEFVRKDELSGGVGRGLILAALEGVEYAKARHA